MLKKVVGFIKFYKTISISLDQISKYYKYIILFISFFIAAYVAIPTYTNYIKFESPKELFTNYCVIFYLIILIDVILQLNLIKQKKLYERNKLNIYPYHPNYIKIYPYAVLFFDNKLLIWIVFTCILLFKYVLLKTNIYMIPLGLILITQVYFSINTFLYYAVQYIYTIIFKGNILGVIIFLNVIIFNFLNISKKMDLLGKIPIIRNLSNIFSSTNHSLYIIYNDILIINSMFIISIVILLCTINLRK